MTAAYPGANSVPTGDSVWPHLSRYAVFKAWGRGMRRQLLAQLVQEEQSQGTMGRLQKYGVGACRGSHLRNTGNPTAEGKCPEEGG